MTDMHIIISIIILSSSSSSSSSLLSLSSWSFISSPFYVMHHRSLLVL